MVAEFRGGVSDEGAGHVTCGELETFLMLELMNKSRRINGIPRREKRPD